MILKISYILLTIAVLIFLIYIGFKAIHKTSSTVKEKQKHKIYLIAGLLIWHVYLYVVSFSGILNTFDFPPRFVLLLILPLFIFTGIFFYTNRNKNWITSIPTSWLFYFQSIRVLIESLFVGSVAAGILHKEVTIEGYNFDMIYALTIPVIGYLVFYRKVLSKKMALLWNYLGITVIASIIFVFMTSIYNPEMYGSLSPLLPMAGLQYPYTLIAGFLMPSAVFLHVWNILQLRKS